MLAKWVPSWIRRIGKVSWITNVFGHCREMSSFDNNCSSLRGLFCFSSSSGLGSKNLRLISSLMFYSALSGWRKYVSIMCLIGKRIFLKEISVSGPTLAELFASPSTSFDLPLFFLSPFAISLFYTFPILVWNKGLNLFLFNNEFCYLQMKVTEPRVINLKNNYWLNKIIFFWLNQTHFENQK